MKGVYRFMALLLAVFLASAFWLPTAVRAQVPAQPNFFDLVQDLDARLTTLEATVAAQQTTITTLQSDLTTAQGQISTLQTDVAAITVPANLLALADFVSVDTGPINGLDGPHVIFEGANVHIQSGSGFTTDDDPDTEPVEPLTGLGNLVVGYNEARPDPAIPLVLDFSDRGGSHNLIVGPEHKYSSFGGLVVAFRNTVSNISASVSGGAAIEASGSRSSVSGGVGNDASGDNSSVSGGGLNEASGPKSSVSGGVFNTASGVKSSVSGGKLNEASGTRSSVSGGSSRTAPGTFNWAAGGLFEND